MISLLFFVNTKIVRWWYLLWACLKIKWGSRVRSFWVSSSIWCCRSCPWMINILICVMMMMMMVMVMIFEGYFFILKLNCNRFVYHHLLILRLEWIRVATSIIFKHMSIACLAHTRVIRSLWWKYSFIECLVNTLKISITACNIISILTAYINVDFLGLVPIWICLLFNLWSNHKLLIVISWFLFFLEVMVWTHTLNIFIRIQFLRMN